MKLPNNTGERNQTRHTLSPNEVSSSSLGYFTSVIGQMSLMGIVKQTQIFAITLGCNQVTAKSHC